MIQHHRGACMTLSSNRLAACRQCMHVMFVLAHDLLDEANGDPFAPYHTDPFDPYHGSLSSDGD